MRSANNVMTAVYERLQQKQQKSQENSVINSSRAFCELMYQKLLSIPNEDDREILQFELHSVMINFKRQKRCDPYARSSSVEPLNSVENLNSNQSHWQPQIPYDSSFVTMLNNARSTLHDQAEDNFTGYTGYK
jgi:hypothetical protein